MVRSLGQALRRRTRDPVGVGGLVASHAMRMTRAGTVTVGRAFGLDMDGPATPAAKDSRFAEAAWRDNAVAGQGGDDPRHAGADDGHDDTFSEGDEPDGGEGEHGDLPQEPQGKAEENGGAGDGTDDGVKATSVASRLPPTPLVA